jgi:hypothetical protein
MYTPPSKFAKPDFDATNPLVAYIHTDGTIYIEEIPYTKRKKGYGYEVLYEGEALKDPYTGKPMKWASYELLYAIQFVTLHAVRGIKGVSEDKVDYLLSLLKSNYDTMFPNSRYYYL